VEALKDDEEVGVRYMQEWEERELEKIDARNAGRMEGEQNKLREQVQKKVEKNYSAEKIAEDLEESVETIQKIMKEI
ncbi:MAG TPA: hypothetical protein IAA11_05770, partial [Candidatus Blautia intestinigallinarum]|nr:hypothetical protein [Candidatus Blautia intestinigallinarum]